MPSARARTSGHRPSQAPDQDATGIGRSKQPFEWHAGNCDEHNIEGGGCSTANRHFARAAYGLSEHSNSTSVWARSLTHDAITALCSMSISRCRSVVLIRQKLSGRVRDHRLPPRRRAAAHPRLAEGGHFPVDLVFAYLKESYDVHEQHLQSFAGCRADHSPAGRTRRARPVRLNHLLERTVTSMDLMSRR